MCFGLSTGAKTRLESRIKKFTPHCIYSGAPSLHGNASMYIATLDLYKVGLVPWFILPRQRLNIQNLGRTNEVSCNTGEQRQLFYVYYI